MEITSVLDERFAAYGQIHQGYYLEDLLAAMKRIPPACVPVDGVGQQQVVVADLEC